MNTFKKIDDVYDGSCYKKGDIVITKSYKNDSYFFVDEAGYILNYSHYRPVVPNLQFEDFLWK